MTRTCEVESCERAWKVRRLCGLHYSRWRAHGDPLVSKTGPDSRSGDCEFPECASTKTSVVLRSHLCSEHADLVKGQAGELSRELVSVGFQDGYIYGLPSRARSRVALHRLLMAERLGRPLRPGETVHHRNGNRTDNTPGNLELWLKPQPGGQRVVDKLAWARWILEQYD